MQRRVNFSPRWEGTRRIISARSRALAILLHWTLPMQGGDKPSFVCLGLLDGGGGVFGALCGNVTGLSYRRLGRNSNRGKAWWNEPHYFNKESLHDFFSLRCPTREWSFFMEITSNGLRAAAHLSFIGFYTCIALASPPNKHIILNNDPFYHSKIPHIASSNESATFHVGKKDSYKVS